MFDRQISYGAVILSFLGAIHWGFEFAGYGGKQGPIRYAMGVFPVLVGWPSLLLSPQLALAAQWSVFTAVWYIDSRATVKGWAPKWYSTVRIAHTQKVLHPQSSRADTYLAYSTVSPLQPW
jgi:hypothetical protein